MREAMPYEGMTETEQDIYTVARFVRLPCGRLDAFFKVLEMCGYELQKKSSSPEPQNCSHPTEKS